MSDPTIRLSTCRGDGRCPECGEPTVDLEPAQVCGCSVCFSVGCVAKHSGDLLTEALRQRDAYDAEVKHVEEPLDEIAALCGCPEWEYPGQVIRDVKALREERDAAIRERDEARAQVRAFQRAAEASVERQRGDAAIYQRDKERERADCAEALLAEARAEHRDISERYIAASSARIRAEALLGDCRAVLERFESLLGAADMEERAPGSQELLAKIREFLAHK